MSSRSYILQIMLWHQLLKSIHYRTILIFQNKKNNRFEGQNMGGIKEMLSPHVKTWGGYITPIPPRIYALDSDRYRCMSIGHRVHCCNTLATLVMGSYMSSVISIDASCVSV